MKENSKINFIICWHPNKIPLNESLPFCLVAETSEEKERSAQTLQDQNWIFQFSD